MCAHRRREGAGGDKLAPPLQGGRNFVPLWAWAHTPLVHVARCFLPPLSGLPGATAPRPIGGRGEGINAAFARVAHTFLNTPPPGGSHVRPSRPGYHLEPEVPGRKSTPPGIPARRKVSLFRRPPGVHIWNSAGSPAGPDPPERAVPSPYRSPHGEHTAGPHGGDLPRSNPYSPAADTDALGHSPPAVQAGSSLLCQNLRDVYPVCAAPFVLQSSPYETKRQRQRGAHILFNLEILENLEIRLFCVSPNFPVSPISYLSIYLCLFVLLSHRLQRIRKEIGVVKPSLLPMRPEIFPIRQALPPRGVFQG